MDKIDETLLALCEFLRQPLDAGTIQVWPGADHLMEGLTLIGGHVLAVLREYEDRAECNWAKYEALDGRRCVHYAEGRLPRYQGEPLRECRLALVEQLEELVGPRERAADVLTKEILDDALQELWDAGGAPRP